MQIVITGAAGHIGSALIRTLPKSFPNAHFVLIDSFMSQRYPSIFHLDNDIKYTIYQEDLKTFDLTKIISKGTKVINLAAITDAAGSFSNAKIVEENNFLVTEQVATACAKMEAKLIALSSTSVYGTQSDEVSEDCSSDELNPQSPYAETKLKEEDLLKHLKNTANLHYTCCRFGTIYGPSIGMRFHTAVNKFCWQAALGLPITVWRTAYNQKRPYLYLGDAVEAISFILQEEIFEGETFNVLTENLTVKDVTDAIKAFYPSLSIEFVDTEIMNQLSYEVSNKKFCDRGFSFHGDIITGIDETFKYLYTKN